MGLLQEAAAKEAKKTKENLDSRAEDSKKLEGAFKIQASAQFIDHSYEHAIVDHYI